MESVKEAVLEGTVDVTVCYCSVYDTCWMATLQEVMQRPQDKVPTPVTTGERDDCDAVPASGI